KGALRLRPTTSCPAPASRAAVVRPTSPLTPVTKTRMFAALSSCPPPRGQGSPGIPCDARLSPDFPLSVPQHESPFRARLDTVLGLGPVGRVHLGVGQRAVPLV